MIRSIVACAGLLVMCMALTACEEKPATDTTRPPPEQPQPAPGEGTDPSANPDTSGGGG